MTRRERIAARLAKRQEWAAARERRELEAWNRSRAATEGIPFGQPILVGHHSEKRHRAAVDRGYSAADKALEHSRMAKHHASKAGGLAAQLDSSIYSDDPDAIEALEAKAVALEAKRDAYKAVNAAYRKAGKPARDDVKGWTKVAEIAGESLRGLVLDGLRNMVAAHWEKQPFPSYTTSNIGATIRNARKRIETIKAQTAQLARAEDAGGTLIEQHAGGYCSVTFDEKPERSTLDALKAAGFHWSRPRWYGKADALPECVKGA